MRLEFLYLSLFPCPVYLFVWCICLTLFSTVFVSENFSAETIYSKPVIGLSSPRADQPGAWECHHDGAS